MLTTLRHITMLRSLADLAPSIHLATKLLHTSATLGETDILPPEVAQETPSQPSTSASEDLQDSNSIAQEFGITDPKHAERFERLLSTPIQYSKDPISTSPEEDAFAYELYKLHNSSMYFPDGQMIVAKVLQADRKGVLLDTGLKTSKIPTAELTSDSIVEMAPNKSGRPREEGEIRPGDLVKVFLEERETPEGEMLVSGQQAAVERRIQAVWSELRERLKDGQPVKGRIMNRIPGGFVVGIAGISGFVPYSAVTSFASKKIGVLQEWKVISMSSSRMNVVLEDYAFSRGGLVRSARQTRVYAVKKQHGRSRATEVEGAIVARELGLEN